MLEYYYRWLIHTSSTPADKYHIAWQLVDQYWNDNPDLPFNVQAYARSSWVTSQSRKLINKFFREMHYMVFLENRWIFADLVELTHMTCKVAIVKFTWGSMRVVEWAE